MKAKPKAAPKRSRPRTAIVFGRFLTNTCRVVKSLAGFLAQVHNPETGHTFGALLIADGRIAGSDGGRWLPHAGWTDAELADLGFLCVGTGATRRWIAPADREGQP